MKRLTVFAAVAFISVFTCTHSAWAQKVYRCGNSYSQSPCASGKGVEVPVEDARSADQKADIERATQRNARAAEALERTRLEEEKQLELKYAAEAKQAEEKRVLAQKQAAREKAIAEKKELLELRALQNQQLHKPALHKPKPLPKPRLPKTGAFEAQVQK